MAVKVACLGDSITRGTDSYDWVTDVQQQMGEGYQLLNFGINGELAYNNLQRIDKLVAVKPDYVVILIGTNDVMAIMSGFNTKFYMANAQLPRVPDMEWYAANLEQIIITLQQQTQAKIALTSLPVLGEALGDKANHTVNKYNEVVRKLASTYKLSYLPLNEQMTAYLQVHPVEKPVAYKARGIWPMIKQGIARRIFGQSGGEVLSANGLQVTCDTVHLNEVSGKMMVDLVVGFVSSAH